MYVSKTVELGVGIFVVLGVGALLFLAMQVSNLGSLGGNDFYTVKANFENVGGLKVRSPITVSGVRVGKVSAIEYDNEEYEAVVSLQLDSAFSRFPEDTAVSIFTAGLLGEQYVSLEPGGSEVYLKEGDKITLTQPALVLEELIGQFLFNKASE